MGLNRCRCAGGFTGDLCKTGRGESLLLSAPKKKVKIELKNGYMFIGFVEGISKSHPKITLKSVSNSGAL